jgi:hypothetical protein
MIKLLVLFIGYVFFIVSPAEDLHLKIKVFNEKREELKLGSIELSVKTNDRRSYILYSKKASCYLLKMPKDTVSLYITQPGYEPIRSKFFMPKVSDTCYLEFTMVRLRKVEF